MRKGPFIFLLVSLLCLLLLPFCLSETNFTNKAEDHYKQLQQGRPRKDLQGSEQTDAEKGLRKFRFRSGDAVAVVRNMRARGVYGGASDMRRGRSKNDANPIRIKSTSSLLWKVSCGFFSFCLLLTGF